MSRKRPVFLIVAGGNGVGKSTFAKSSGVIDAGFGFLNPDFIQRVHGLSDGAAARKMIEYVDEALRLCAGNMAIETTLAGNRPLQLIVKAKELGWDVQLIYLGVDHVDIQIERVNERARKGGHAIAEDTIRRRYERSHDALKAAIQLCSIVAVYDNTVTPKALCSFEDGRLKWQAHALPDWLQRILAV